MIFGSEFGRAESAVVSGRLLVRVERTGKKTFIRGWRKGELCSGKTFGNNFGPHCGNVENRKKYI